MPQRVRLQDYGKPTVSGIIAELLMICLAFMFMLYIFNCLSTRGLLYVLEHFLVDTSPYFWACMGIGACLTLSISGAAIGIFTAGVSIIGAGVQAPHIRTRNLISIVFCEVVGIYGLIMAIILSGFTQDYEWLTAIRRQEPEGWLCGYIVFATGMIVGFVNLFAGVAVGIVGSSAALSDAANPSLFMKVLVIEIFASALGLYGLITGVYMMSKAAWT